MCVFVCLLSSNIKNLSLELMIIFKGNSQGMGLMRQKEKVAVFKVHVTSTLRAAKYAENEKRSFKHQI